MRCCGIVLRAVVDFPYDYGTRADPTASNDRLPVCHDICGSITCGFLHRRCPQIDRAGRVLGIAPRCNSKLVTCRSPRDSSSEATGRHPPRGIMPRGIMPLHATWYLYPTSNVTLPNNPYTLPMKLPTSPNAQPSYIRVAVRSGPQRNRLCGCVLAGRTR